MHSMMVRSDLRVEHWLLSESLSIQIFHWIIAINGTIKTDISY